MCMVRKYRPPRGRRSSLGEDLEMWSRPFGMAFPATLDSCFGNFVTSSKTFIDKE
jgi:hypothetical protein